MEIAFHIGANCTDGDRLLKSLLRDVDRLAEAGVAVPGPGRYRSILREAVAAEMQGRGAPGTREVLMDAILDGRETRRVVLSNSTFLALPARLFDGGAFYGTTAARLEALRRLFPGDRIELNLALRNPAGLVPAVWAQAKSRDIEGWFAGVGPERIRWFPVIEAIRRSAPEMGLRVWCNEDAALLWPDILLGLAGLGEGAPLSGRHDLLEAIMSPDGLERFRSYMSLHPGQTAEQERRVVGAFLDKYAIAAETWDEADLPGWTATTFAAVTEAYEADVARIAAMPGVTFLQP
ncbi:hypothetical protein [Rubellimicrobium sp. CFH 75288]|uniref:hypothetical protein n=1 Tax=Rubellimicrobium sp. CFH 75288 TaxID=2697034 RepID=UPI001411DE1A|nr:hypothetical protein [Rubellimicrobium sp. CFH 75288]NAZ37870.1 hypothetical protein [Rubellimicrobium sp. CFH 75288]